jgi:hypothetical protein
VIIIFASKNEEEYVQMRKEKNGCKEWTDASLQYYHRDTLKYLLKLNVITYQKQPNDYTCTTELSDSFVELLKNNTNGHNNLIWFEQILGQLAQSKGIQLKKPVLYDMIKLMALDFSETSLSYYDEQALAYLKNLGFVIQRETSDGNVLSIERTPYFSALLKDYDEKTTNKMASLDRIIKTFSQKKKIRLSKKLRYDMIKLMGFIDKFGEDGKIWATNG